MKSGCLKISIYVVAFLVASIILALSFWSQTSKNVERKFRLISKNILLKITPFPSMVLTNQQDDILQSSDATTLEEDNVPLRDLSQNSPEKALIPLPEKHIIPGGSHSFQTFNNCGPASLSMALSLFGKNVSQQELGQQLRPYQNPQGINDDKSVTLEELAEKAKEYNLITYYRPNGNIDLLIKLISQDIPVITRTLTKKNEDIGHYRVIKGYDQVKNILIQDDSLQGKNLEFNYQDFYDLWSRFGNEYLVIATPDKEKLVSDILAENLNEISAWENAKKHYLEKISRNEDITYSRFNLSIAHSKLGEHEKAIAEYEKVADLLPFRTLWYQIEPIESYLKIGNYDKVFRLSDEILQGGNRAYSELYLLRAEAYRNLGNIGEAQKEEEKARIYKKIRS